MTSVTLSEPSVSATRAPLRVLFAIPTLEPGGSERQLVELVERTHPRPLDAAVVTLRAGSDAGLPTRLARRGVPHWNLAGADRSRAMGVGPSLVRLRRVVRGFRPDVIYAWLEEAALLGVPLGRAHGIPVVVARRNVSGHYAQRSKAVVGAIHRVDRLAQIVTCNSSAVMQEGERRGISGERLVLVRNGHEVLPPLGAPRSDLVALGYVAHLREEKGHRRLLEVLSRIRAEAPWRCDLAGDGPLWATLAAEIEARGLADRVRMLGTVADPRAFWASRAAAVLLSDHEGSPNALIEAAMAGRPAVGTDVGGTADVIAPAGGFVIAPTDFGEIAGALDRLIDDPDLRARLGQGAHRQARERFSMEQFVGGHVSALERAVGGEWTATKRGR